MNLPDERPEISVLTVAHQAAAFLPMCWASVRAQMGATWEWVVVDNGNADGSAELLARWAAEDARVRVVRSDLNVGQKDGRALGLADCRGDFIAFLDADDIALPGRLAAQAEVLRAQPDAVAVYGRAEIIGKNGAVLGPAFTAQSESALRDFARFTMPVVHSMGMMRRDPLVEIVARPTPPHACDYAIVCHALERGRVLCLPQTVGQYRWHSGGLCESHLIEQAICGAGVGLLAARRQAGRPEDAAGMTAWCAELNARLRSLGEVYAAFAARARAEEFPWLELYHARRALRRGFWRMAWRVAAVAGAGQISWSERRRRAHFACVGTARFTGAGGGLERPSDAP